MKMLKSTHLIKTKNTFIDCTGRTREPKYDDCSWKTPGNEKNTNGMKCSMQNSHINTLKPILN